MTDPSVLSLAPDLLVRSKIELAARHYGVGVHSAPDAAGFLAALALGPWKLVIIDLDLQGIDGPALVREARAQTGARVVGSCSHVETGVIRASRQAGAHTVMANSTFVAAIPGLFAEAAGLAASPGVAGTPPPQG